MKLLATVVLVLFCNQVFAEIESVIVLDGQFQHLSRLTEERDLAEFSSLWETKVKVDGLVEHDWSGSYKIDISGGKGFGRWLYYEGWIMRLGKSKSALYHIEEPGKLELLLGISHNNSLKSGTPENGAP